MIGVPATEPLVSLSEAQAHLRLESGDEEALLASYLRTASALCETFLNQIVIRRAFTEEVLISTEWQKLRSSPVRLIDTVFAVDAQGAARRLASGDFAVDIDAQGYGWVRSTTLIDGVLLQVGGVAGMAEGPNNVPEPVRQGVLRLTAHLFANRDGPGGEPPAAVTALWRPFRRMRLA